MPNVLSHCLSAVNSLHCTLLAICDLTRIWRNGNLHQKNKPSKHVSTLNRDWTPRCFRNSLLCRPPCYPLPHPVWPVCYIWHSPPIRPPAWHPCRTWTMESEAGKAQLISPNVPSRFLHFHFLSVVLTMCKARDGVLSPTVAMWTIPNCSLPVL